MASVATGRRRGIIDGIPVSFLAVWAAIYAVAAILPAIPLVGGGTFGGQEFLVPIAGFLFGPIGGLVAAGIGGLLASFVGPATAYFGLATFYPHAIGGLAAGLLMKNTRVSRLAVLGMLVFMALAWPLLPAFSKIGSYVYAHWAYWPMYLTGVVGIALSPWAVKQIRTFEPTSVTIGVAMLSWTTYMVNHVAVSLGYSYLYPEGPAQWVFAFNSGIVPGQRLLLAGVGTVVGAALIVGLHRAGIRFPPGSGSALAEGEDEVV